MAYFDTDSARYGFVRRLETTDWAHADVLNATIGQAVENAAALYAATWRIKNIRIAPSAWSNKQYRIADSHIREDSLCDVYFANDSKDTVQESMIEGKTLSGALLLTCDTVPGNTIVIDCIEIRNEVDSDAG